MEKKKKVVNLVLHKATGAIVPVVVRKVDENNVITDYAEHTDKRKGFTVMMLQDRWDKCFEDVLELLQEYQVPAYVTHASLVGLQEGQLAVTKAIFFEEYIYGIEQKANIPHRKLKSRELTVFTEH